MQALAAAIVAFTMLYFKRLYTIDPNAVYRKALVTLNTNPGVLEVGSTSELSKCWKMHAGVIIF